MADKERRSVTVLKKGLVALTAVPIFLMVGRLPYVYPGLVVYTIMSLSTECIFTGFGDQIRRVTRRAGIDWDLPCRSYLWAPFVYGVSAAVSFPLMDYLGPGLTVMGTWQWPAGLPAFYHWPWWIRGAIFSIGIFAWEFYWGWFIESIFGKCPWEYQVSTYRIWRYIRPRYCLFWGGFGFVLEWTHLHLIHRLDQILPIVLGQ